MRVFVTGGSGFIGTRLVRALLDGGHEVVCLSRSGRTSAQLADIGAEVLSGDLTDPDVVRSCVGEAGPTHVAHLAAEFVTQRDSERIEQVNVGGTEALLQACRELDGLEGFLFVSSLVRGDAGADIISETDEIPASTPFGKSKAQGDELVLNARTQWGIPSVVLRPSHVYGPGGWLGDLVRDKSFRIPGKGDAPWGVVHVDDVVSACILLLLQCPVGEVFHVVDDEPVTMKTFFDNVATALNRKPYGHAPAWLTKLFNGAGTITAVASARSSNIKLKDLGWVPVYPSSTEALPGVVAELTEEDTDSAA